MEYFVLGIGGTGMRCIESLIHLCAMGMFDDTTIHLLALDTDKNNGNFTRLKELKDAYLNAKGIEANSRTPQKDTFFSANIKYYEFSPNYERKSSFSDVFDYPGARYNKREESDLADLVFTQDVETFNLRHGYRAQTHLGSMMMYHSIIEAAESNTSNDMKKFLEELTTAANSGHPRVFILGSVFGGTGASSIPIIPQAITVAASRLSNVADIMKNAYFGSTLLTAYFSFNAPTAQELKNEKIIATSDKFALNSQVAMMFYNDDSTVRSTYQRFYMLGTDNQTWKPMGEEQGVSKTITGGESQKNDSHYIELMAACAAWDFFNLPESTLEDNKSHIKTDYVYRSLDVEGQKDSIKLDFKDFVGNNAGADKAFARKFGLLLVFAILCNGKDNFVESVGNGSQKDITDFRDMDVHQVESLKKYFNLFHVSNVSEVLKEGWVYQIHRSAGGGDAFLFNPEFFSPRTQKDLNKLDWNDKLYRNEGIGKEWKFKTGLFGTRFDSFKKKFIAEWKDRKPTDVTNPCELFYKLMYNTLSELYNNK